MTAINSMSYVEWYRAVEINFTGSSFSPEISRPLALPLLVQNFRLKLNSDMKIDQRTEQMHSYHVTYVSQTNFLLEMITEPKYNNRDFFLEIVLPQPKCPDNPPCFEATWYNKYSVQDKFGKPLGEMLDKDFAASESQMMGTLCSNINLIWRMSRRRFKRQPMTVVEIYYHLNFQFARKKRDFRKAPASLLSGDKANDGLLHWTSREMITADERQCIRTYLT